MIISKTPLRISFVGGGTDLRDFYSKDYGSVVSTTIDKYMYITVTKRFDDNIRVSYSKTEITSSVEEIQHPIVKETLKMLGIDGGVEITSIADIPSGTGMGSSSSFTVGLLNALHAFQGKHAPAEQLAREACEIEIETLKEPIGKQDQYIAAYGGLQQIIFNSDESVFVNPIICTKDRKNELNRRLILFYMGTTRPASSVLYEQKKNTESKADILRKMRDLTFDLRKLLTEGTDLNEFGRLLHRNWEYKRQLAGGITSEEIDNYYEKAMKAGALGGKILGAGRRRLFIAICRKG